MTVSVAQPVSCWLYVTIISWIWYSHHLVGGLEHFLFFHILGIIIPTDELIFFRGVGQPPTSYISHSDHGFFSLDGYGSAHKKGFLLFSYQFIAGSEIQWISLRENLQETMVFTIKYGVSKPIHWEMDVHPFIWKTIAFDHVWPIITCKHITYKKHGFCHSLMMSTGNEYRAVK